MQIDKGAYVYAVSREGQPEKVAYFNKQAILVTNPIGREFLVNKWSKLAH